MLDDENKGKVSNDGEKGYEVGYAKPPKRTRFQKGQSGNPSGRRKGSRSFKSHVLEAVREQITVKDNGQNKRISKGQAAAIQLVNKAVMGDWRIAKFIVELIGGLEEKEEQVVVAQQNGQTALDRIHKKLDAMRANWLQSQGLPPDDDESGTAKPQFESKPKPDSDNG